MSITGHLLQVDPAVGEQLRTDDALVQHLTMQATLGGLSGLNDPGALADLLDGAARGAGPLGCLWALVPGFLRRRMIDGLVEAAKRSEAEENARWAEAPHGPPPEAVLPPDADDDDDDDFEAELAKLSPEDRAEVEKLEAHFAAQAAAVQSAATSSAPEGTFSHLDLHKHWQLLHVALTGSADEVPGPAGDAILGGEPLGEDLGYGPARLLDPARVRTVAALLAELGPEGVAARLDPRGLSHDVYGAEFVRERGWKAELQGRAGALCTFYAEAAREGRAVVLWLS